jgi:uncharacterized membrane protein
VAVNTPAAQEPSEHGHLRRGRFFDRLLDPTEFGKQARALEPQVIAAFRRAAKPESRVLVSAAILVAITLQLLLPARVANQPRWLLPGIALLLLVGILIANPTGLDRPSRPLRGATLLMIAFLSIANAGSAVRLISDLVNGTGIRNPKTLLFAGAAIWTTNVIVFGLWYWEFDSGGPVARLVRPRAHTDFLFPQKTDEKLEPPGWKPEFFDYLYTSFTNATAFSPTDVMPLTRWAKFTMMLQSAISLALAILVIARAVNILK